MHTIHELNERLDAKEDVAVSLELDIFQIQEDIRSAVDETHITFLTDHLSVLKYELDKVNAEIYISRQELKILENEELREQVIPSIANNYRALDN